MIPAPQNGMFGDLFKRRRKDERAAATPAAPRRQGGEAPAPIPTPRAAAATPPSAPRAADGGEILHWLSLDVRSRVGELTNALARADRASDAPRFLEALPAGFESVVRQPPLAAQRALSVTRDPNAPTSKLVGLVEQDPKLGQALLRYANSAFYATGGGRVVSLHGAVQRVGTAGVHNVVLKTMVDGMLCRPGSAYQHLVEKVWAHMVRTAPIARGLAPAFGASPDEAFALGLLHDVGKLVVFDRLGELRQTLRRDVIFPAPLLTAVLRLLHEPLGGLAAVQWGLGPTVAHAIATHHRSPLPEILDARCELLFLSEKIDIARLRGEFLSLEHWWRDGALTTPREKVERAIAALPDDATEQVLA